MAEKTIMKLYANGNLETIDTQLQQSFEQKNNLFIKETVTSGYLDASGEVFPPTSDEEVISDYIAVQGGNYTLRILWQHTNTDNSSYYNLGFYDSNKNFLTREYRFSQVSVSTVDVPLIIPNDVAYVRISVSFIDVADVLFYTDRDSQNIYSFTRNDIIVPKIIEYPPEGYRNYFIEKTSVPGYVREGSEIRPPDEHDRVSDFIDVTGWGNGVVRVIFENMDASYRPWLAISFFNGAKDYLSMYYDDYLTPTASIGDYIFELTFPVDITYIRVSVNYYDKPLTNVKLSVEQGTVATLKHYLAFEDMPDWVVNTGKPISIFPEGIVINGELIQTNS